LALGAGDAYVGTPNCDYFNLPAEIDTAEKLIQWLGVTHVFPSKKNKNNREKRPKKANSADAKSRAAD